MERLRRKRGIIRSAVTRCLTEVELELRDNPDDTNSLYDHLEELIRKEESLIQLDTQIEEATDDENLEEEISVSEEYKENINRLKRRLERQICILEGEEEEECEESENTAKKDAGMGTGREEEEECEGSKDTAKKDAGMGTGTKVAIGAAIGVAAVAGAACTLLFAPAVAAGAGITSAGLAAGSAATSIKSAFLGGAIAKGGAFALCQGAGATAALSTSTLVGVGTAGGTAAGVGAGVAAKSMSSETESKGGPRKKKSKLPHSTEKKTAGKAVAGAGVDAKCLIPKFESKGRPREKQSCLRLPAKEKENVFSRKVNQPLLSSERYQNNQTRVPPRLSDKEKKIVFDPKVDHHLQISESYPFDLRPRV